MKHPLPLAAGLVIACGGAAPMTSGGVSLDVVLSRAFADEIGAFQLTVFQSPAGKCSAVQPTCVTAQPDILRGLFHVTDSQGRSGRAVLVTNALGTNLEQPFELRDVPVGKDYLLVAEALSTASPPALLGHGCTVVSEVTTGSTGTAVTVVRRFLEPLPTCDPRVDGP